MYPQYTQGYQQTSVPNPMMPQYQPTVQYQQPMQLMQPMGQPMQPQWNNAPLANQPANVTQTGIPFDQIRQDLANMILQNGSRDALAQALYNDTSFNNFQSGALDKLVTAVALTVDYDARTNPNAPLQQLYSNAIREVYDIAWAARIQNMPQIANDPNNAQLVQYCNQMIQLGNQRKQLFQQSGMLAQRPVQPVQSWQMNNGYNNGYQQYGQYNRAPTVGATSPSPMYQPTGPQYNQTSYYNNRNDDVSDAHTLRTVNTSDLAKALKGSKYGGGSGVTQQPTPTYQTNQANQTNNTSNNFTPTVPAGSQPVRNMPVLPNQILKSDDNIVYGQQMLTPQPLSQGSEQETLLPTMEEIRNNIQRVDISSPTFWAEVQQDEYAEQNKIDPRKLGLKEDEVRYLTKNEARALIKQGLRCEEYHPMILISADPLINALHFVLTKDNKIRQVITRLDENGVQMERSVHDDILAPIRNSSRMKQIIKEGKHRRFMTTTSGGVVYDRFKTSRIVLPEALKEASRHILEEKLEGEAKQKVIDEAFEKFKKTFERELEQDYNGVAQFIANNTPEDSEEEVLPTEIELPTEEREERMKNRLEQYAEINTGEIITLMNVFDTTNRRNQDTLTENAPLIQDSVIHDVFEPNEIIHVFNTPEERRKIVDVLKPLYWSTEPDKDYFEELKKFDPEQFMKQLEGKVPSELYERFNLYATNAVNKGIKYIFGADATIDNFAQDYGEFMDWARNNNKLINKAYCIAFLELNLRYVLHSLTDTPDISLKESDIDLIAQRAIVRMNCFQNTSIPVTAYQLGLETADTTINATSHPEIFNIVRDRYQLQALSSDYNEEDKEKDHPYAPITASYLTFAAGEKYRIWPALQLVQEKEDDFDITSFTLEYLGNSLI